MTPSRRRRYTRRVQKTTALTLLLLGQLLAVACGSSSTSGDSSSSGNVLLENFGSDADSSEAEDACLKPVRAHLKSHYKASVLAKLSDITTSATSRESWTVKGIVSYDGQGATRETATLVCNVTALDGNRSGSDPFDYKVSWKVE